MFSYLGDQKKFFPYLEKYYKSELIKGRLDILSLEAVLKVLPEFKELCKYRESSGMSFQEDFVLSGHSFMVCDESKGFCTPLVNPNEDKVRIESGVLMISKGLYKFDTCLTIRDIYIVPKVSISSAVAVLACSCSKLRGKVLQVLTSYSKIDKKGCKNGDKIRYKGYLHIVKFLYDACTYSVYRFGSVVADDIAGDLVEFNLLDIESVKVVGLGHILGLKDYI